MISSMRNPSAQHTGPRRRCHRMVRSGRISAAVG